MTSRAHCANKCALCKIRIHHNLLSRDLIDVTHMTHFNFLASTARPGNRRDGVCAWMLRGGLMGVIEGRAAGGFTDGSPCVGRGSGVRGSSPT